MKTAPVSLERLFDVIDSLVDEHVGVIRDVIEVKKEAGAPNLFCFYARACNTKALSPQSNFAHTGGASSDRRLAMAKAIGEAVERYCAALYEPKELPFYSYGSAPFDCIAPDRFGLYSQDQYSQKDFPYVPFTHDTLVRWTSAIDLATGGTHYVPAATVFIPYFYDQKECEFPIVQPISTGLACHCSRAEAAISAICEVIERDAFTIAWQARLGMPHIVIETLSDQNRDLVGRFERTGASIVLLNITMEHGIPTILSVLRNEASDAPALVFAAAAHPDPEHAVRKSLEELALTRRLAQDLKIHLPPLAPEHDYNNVLTQNDHVHLWCDQTKMPLANFIFASQERIEFREIMDLSTGKPESDMNVLVEKIGKVGHQVLLADVTTPDIQDLGLSVVRAVIPGFNPLCFGHRFRALSGSRLWQVPQTLGYAGISHASGDNLLPHPYP